MSAIKIQSKLPAGGKNGLPSILDELCDNPRRIHYALVAIDCESTTTNNDTGDIIPTVRALRIEPTLKEDRKAVRRLMERALEQRTGRAMLPIDLEDDTLAALTDAYDTPGE